MPNSTSPSARRLERQSAASVRLRLDANEVWDMLTARRMFEALKPYDPEFIEQPIPGRTGAEGLVGFARGHEYSDRRRSIGLFGGRCFCLVPKSRGRCDRAGTCTRPAG